MKKLSVFLVVLLISISGQAFADDKYYWKGAIGLSVLEDSNVKFKDENGSYDIGKISADPGFALTTAIGRDMGKGFSAEVEFGYKKTDYDKFKGKSFTYPVNSRGTAELKIPDFELKDADVSTKTLMFNGLYNYNNASMFTPYGGVGIGIAWNDVDVGNFEESDTNFAWQLLAGVETEVANNLAVMVGYRYLSAGEFSIEEKITGTYDSGKEKFDANGEGSFDLDSHTFEIGTKYSF